MRVTMIVVGALFAVAAWAQTNSGTIKGTVVDPSGAGVPNVSVQARNVETDIVTKAQTGADGAFTFVSLMPGKYELTIGHTGFKKAVLQSVLVHIGETTRADIPLQIGDVSQNVEVVGEAGLIAPDTVAATTVLTSREYDNLPLAAVSRVRIPTDFALLTPGVIGSQQRPG